MREIDLAVSPADLVRRFDAGWTVLDALFATGDNALDAGAANVWIQVRRADPADFDARKNNVVYPTLS